MVGYLWMFEKENKRESESGSLMFTFHVKMISIWTFPRDPGTENRVSIAERVANLRHLRQLTCNYSTGESWQY